MQKELDQLRREALKKLNAGCIFDEFYTGSPRLDEQNEAIKTARRFQAQKGVFLTLLGSTGTGKTIAGIVALTDAMANRANAMQTRTYGHYTMNGRLIKTTDLSEALGTTGIANKRELFNTELLMIDDLRTGGEGMVSPALITLMDELIDHRYCHKKLTIITSNTTAESFRKTYGDRITSRLQHLGVLAVLRGSDLRIQPE